MEEQRYLLQASGEWRKQICEALGIEHVHDIWIHIPALGLVEVIIKKYGEGRELETMIFNVLSNLTPVEVESDH